MAMQWYVVRTAAGRENRAREGILNRLREAKLTEKVDDLIIPVEHVTEVKRGRRVTSERKLYPGYIYAHMEATPEVLEAIHEVDGVSGFLGADPSLPDPLTADEAERIIKIAKATSSDEQRAAIVQIPYNVGDLVKVKEGTFSGMEGTVNSIDPKQGRIEVLIAVFGRKAPVWLEVWQVEVA